MNINCWRMIRLGTRAALIVALSSCSSFSESTFPLSSGCRIPKWFQLGDGVSRNQVTVSADLYVRETGREAKFTLYDAGGSEVATAMGKVDGLEPKRMKDKAGRDIRYETVSIGDVVDAFKYDYSGADPAICMIDNPGL